MSVTVRLFMGFKDQATSCRGGSVLNKLLQASEDESNPGLPPGKVP
jgi:hypothetical protein